MRLVHAGQLRHGDGVGPSGDGGDRRPALADDGRLGGGDHPDLGSGPAHRHLLGRAPVLARRLRRSPSSGSSGWRCRASCWRCSSCTSASRSSALNIGGLFSDEYVEAPWSLAKVWDLLKHLPVPALILGLAGTAQLIRIMRANLLDELRKPYVVTARAKGLSERARDPEVPGAGRAQPVRQHHRLHPALRRLGQHHRLARAEPADGGPAAPAGADRPGHVPGRDHRPAPRRHDGDRDVPLGPAPHVDRSPHPAGGRSNSATVPGDVAAVAPAGVDATSRLARVAEERISVATQWQLMWWRFRRHRLAMVGAPSWSCSSTASVVVRRLPGLRRPEASDAQRGLLPPQRIRWFDDGRWRPHVYGLAGQARPGDLQARLHAGPRAEDPRALLRRGLRVQACSG